ncbi:hypothetical protein [Caldalkalibacillus salinus]|uniref:hypothetical protein n=1 Tax=Caldalkalibacillus salinus TaxID=2803787 RepID=UPI001921A171|nr:hypothetical protein [Caldalkalibacillus salinus]
MKLSYELNGTGWADVKIELNDKSFDMRPSYLGEPLYDLVEAVFALSSYFNPSHRNVKTLKFSWDEEPSLCLWKLKKINDDTVYIEIKYDVDGIGDDTETVIQGECSIREFSEQLIRSMDAMIKEHGILGYLETWAGRDFPFTSYLIMKEYLLEETVERRELSKGKKPKMAYSSLKEEFDFVFRHLKAR